MNEQVTITTDELARRRHAERMGQLVSDAEFRAELALAEKEMVLQELRAAKAKAEELQAKLDEVAAKPTKG